MNFGEKLNAILKERKMSIAELSRRSGISADTLYSYRRRNSRKIAPEVYTAVADALNIDVTYFLDPSASTLTPETSSEDVWQLRDDLRNDPNRRTLLMLAKNGSAEDVRQVAAIVDALRATNPEFYDGDDPA